MTDRDITSAVQTEIGKTVVSPILIAELDFVGGYVRAWTGIGDLIWDSKTWAGLGSQVGVSDIEETLNVVASGLSFQLTAPSSILSIALSEHYQGRPANLWLGFLDDSGNVIADPIGPFGYRMDTMEIDEGAETSTITIQTESRLRDLDRARERRYTHEDQQIDFPGDLGFEYVAGLQDKVIVWGS